MKNLCLILCFLAIPADSLQKNDSIRMDVAQARRIVTKNIAQNHILRDLDSVNAHLDSIIIELEKKKSPRH